MEPELILASGSPRRRELMEKAGYTFTVRPCPDPEIVTETDPGRVAEELSRHKALSAAASAPGRIAVGADTIVVLDGEILGKPRDPEDACRMLRRLSGRTHRVITGVTVASDAGAATFHETTRVSFRDLSEEEIRAYVATGDPLDKAGAYGIQGPFFLYVSGIEGDYYNVVGLPVCRLAIELDKLGVKRK